MGRLGDWDKVERKKKSVLGVYQNVYDCFCRLSILSFCDYGLEYLIGLSKNFS